MTSVSRHWIEQVGRTIGAGRTIDARVRPRAWTQPHLSTLRMTAGEQQPLVDFQRAALKMVGAWESYLRAAAVLQGVVRAWSAFERKWAGAERMTQ